MLVDMAKYLIVGSYPAESWSRMIENPSDRSAVAREAFESLGGSLESYYWAFGPDDWLAIGEVPDDVSAAALSVAASSSGAVTGVRTTRLLTTDESAAVLQRARAAVYHPPGR